MNECPDCNKAAYRSRYDAKRALRFMEGRSHMSPQRISGDRGPLRPYPCPTDSRTWHLGHGNPTTKGISS